MNDEEPSIRRAGEVLDFTSEAMGPKNFIDQTIIRVRFKQTVSYGGLAVVTVEAKDDNGEHIEYHTTSNVLVDQLETLFQKGAFPILASVVLDKGPSGRSYFKLE